MKIGEKIKELRKNRGITQEQLAEKLGISFQAVSKWENDVAYPDITLVPVLAGIFGVTTDYLFDYDVNNLSQLLKIRKPEKYEDVNEIIELLQNQKNVTVIINCESISKEAAEQIKNKIAGEIANVQINWVSYLTLICTLPQHKLYYSIDSPDAPNRIY
jgi:transcriptional regulator with XRE-family HTH domain